MLANLLKEHCLVEGGDANVAQWLKDEGINAPIGSVLKVITRPRPVAKQLYLNTFTDMPAFPQLKAAFSSGVNAQLTRLPAQQCSL